MIRHRELKKLPTHAASKTLHQMITVRATATVNVLANKVNWRTSELLLPSLLSFNCINNRLSFRLVALAKVFNLAFHLGIQLGNTLLQLVIGQRVNLQCFIFKQSINTQSSCFLHFSRSKAKATLN
jgi:hypothetical protein